MSLSPPPFRRIGPSYSQQQPPVILVYTENTINRPIRSPWTSSSSTPIQPTLQTLQDAVLDEQPQLVFRNVRSLSGVIGHETKPTSRSNTVSVLGAAADEYLWAHGYRPGSIRLIREVYEDSAGTNDFVDRLSAAGLAITEARYLFSLINKPHSVNA
jgi:hypothetical protein